MANDERRNNDDATERQRDAGARRGEIIPGKGFDAGTGYGGAGADSAYRGESSYGGPSGVGGDTLSGAYESKPFGRGGSDDESDPNESGAARETDANDDGSAGFDPTWPLGGERRDPVR